MPGGGEPPERQFAAITRIYRPDPDFRGYRAADGVGGHLPSPLDPRFASRGIRATPSGSPFHKEIAYSSRSRASSTADSSVRSLPGDGPRTSVRAAVYVILAILVLHQRDEAATPDYPYCVYQDRVPSLRYEASTVRPRHLRSLTNAA